MLRKGLAATGEPSEEWVDQGVPVFLEHCRANSCNGTEAYPDLEGALEALRGRGVALAICTNKPEKLTRRLLEALGWTNRFDAIVGDDTLPVKKPDPAPLHEALARAGGGRAAFVGDSIVDADTARAVQVPFVAVSFGFSDRPVEALGAHAVIDSYAGLVPALYRLYTPCTRALRSAEPPSALQ